MYLPGAHDQVKEAHQRYSELRRVAVDAIFDRLENFQFRNSANATTGIVKDVTLPSENKPTRPNIAPSLLQSRA